MTDRSPATPSSAVIVCRLARTADLPELQTLYAELIPTETPTLADMALALDRMTVSGLAAVFVAVREEQVIGTCQLAIYDNLVRAPRRKAIIDSVIVHPDWRGMGVGRRLMAHAVAVAAERGCCLVGVSTAFRRQVAQSFYDALGFSRFGYHYLHSPPIREGQER
jgi:GNAT superfamily N-acetyltransferase